MVAITEGDVKAQMVRDNKERNRGLTGEWTMIKTRTYKQQHIDAALYDTFCGRYDPDDWEIYKADFWRNLERLAQQHCSICRTETTGAPLCDRCAHILRRDCKLAHLAIAAGACVGSGTIRNLERDEALLEKYDACHAHHDLTCEVHSDTWETQLAIWREEYGEHEEANDDRPE